MDGCGTSVQQISYPKAQSPPQWGTQVIQGHGLKVGAAMWGLRAGKPWRTSGRLPGEGKAWGVSRSEKEGRQRSRKGEPHTERRDGWNSVGMADSRAEPAWPPGGEKEAHLLPGHGKLRKQASKVNSHSRWAQGSLRV